MASSAVQHVLSKLTGIVHTGSTIKAKCPAHDDKVASLAITEGAGGRALLHCHAGCKTGDVVTALGLKLADLFPTEQETMLTYDYHDADGHVVYQACRLPGKEFRQRRPDGAGGWIWNMKTVKRVPFALHKLKNVDTVFVVEGEKDASRLWSLNLPATTNVGGASKWGASETKALRAAGVQRVVIFPDNDKPGLAHAELVASKCKAVGMSASIICLPDLPNHGDVSDWLDAGRTADDLLTLVGTTPYVVPKSGHVPSVPTGGIVPDGTQDAPAIDKTDAGDEVPDVSVSPSFDPTAFHLTDAGAGEAFCSVFGHMVRFDHRRRHWLLWDDHYWRPDADEQVHRLAVAFAKQWQHAALGIVNYDERRRVTEYALKLEKRGAVESMLWFAKSMLPIACAGDRWDANHWLLGCTNGIVDLRTGDVRAGDRDDFITQQTGNPFDPDAECPRWDQFLIEVFDNDETLIDYVQRALGYSLTGDMREQCFFVGFGSGSNGKSIFLDTLESVWGTYAHRADMRVFAGGSADATHFHMADFRGRRLVFAAETRTNSRMNEHTIKNFTGGESMRVEEKYGDPFTIKPCGKIWLGVNHRPRVMDDSFGFWRRVRLIPFVRTFAGSGEDRMLRDTLRAEAPGILAWAVRGCLRWQHEGLETPAVVMAQTDDYQAGEDPLTEFFEQRTIVDAENEVPFATLFSAYRGWATEQGFAERDKMTAKGFGNALQRRPFERIKSNGVTRYKGLRVIATSLFRE